MSKKLIYFVSVILVLCVGLSPAYVRADLIGYWRFDESSGTIAADSAGGDNDGTLIGDQLGWTAGRSIGALSFPGEPDDARVEFPTRGMSATAGTIAMWGYLFDPQPDTQGRYFFGHTTQPEWNDRIQIYMQEGRTPSTLLDIGLGEDHNLDTDIMELPLEEWLHVALTWDSGSYVVYVNGEEVSRGTYTGLSVIHPVADIGNDGSSAPYEAFCGLLDELQLYDNALSPVEILSAMQGQPFPLASGPSPKDDAPILHTWLNLSWRAGDFAVSHDVYFGDNFDDVNDGAEGTFLGNQAGTEFVVGFPGFAYPDGLVPGTAYYWRIDEVNDTEPNSPWKGEVWTFSINKESVLQFKSGFEPDTYILGDKIKGIDNSGPSGANSWDNLSDYLPWVLMGYGYFEGGSMEISTDPFNSANHVLHLHTFQNDRGYARSQWSLVQVHDWNVEGYKANLFEQQFYRFRMLIPNRISTLYSYDEKSAWYMIWESHAWEFENTRHGIYINKAANSNKWYFKVVQRYPGDFGAILYENKIYQDVVVPMGEWFTFDIFFRYHETNGEFYASIKRDGRPKQTIADLKGQTKFGTKLHDQMMFKLYHDGDYINRTSALGLDGIHQYYDDFEIWSYYPNSEVVTDFLTGDVPR